MVCLLLMPSRHTSGSPNPEILQVKGRFTPVSLSEPTMTFFQITALQQASAHL